MFISFTQPLSREQRQAIALGIASLVATRLHGVQFSARAEEIPNAFAEVLVDAATPGTPTPSGITELEADDAFDVILCDLMMPDVTGMEVFGYVKSARPHLAARVVFMTGGAFTARARAFLDEVPNRCIEKPFELARLRAVIREVR